MARQVMFDPFGSYTQGFDSGAGRQIQTEGAVRQARAQDYDFNTLAPFRLNAIKREDELGAATLPVQKQLLQFTIPNAQANLYDKIYPQAVNAAQIFNTPAPLENLVYDRFGLHKATVGTPGSQEQTLFQVDSNGNYVPVSRQPDFGATALNNLNYARNYQIANMGDLQQYRLAGLTNQAGMVDARQTAAQAAMARAMQMHYPNGVTGGAMVGSGMATGMSMPAQLASPGYYQWPSADAMPQYQPGVAPEEYNLGYPQQ